MTDDDLKRLDHIQWMLDYKFQVEADDVAWLCQQLNGALVTIGRVAHQATTEERERCARVAEEVNGHMANPVYHIQGRAIAKKIREGETT